MNVVTEWAEQGRIPDRAIRFLIRTLLKARLKKEGSLNFSDRLNALFIFRDQLQQEPVAHAVDSANEQHYEVPADLFETFMGPHLKYSSGYWADGATTLAESEKRMLEITCERAQLQDGQQILELGCGWGSIYVDGPEISQLHHHRRLQFRHPKSLYRCPTTSEFNRNYRRHEHL